MKTKGKNMNKIISILALFAAFSVQASKKQVFVETFVVCQQDDGDQWVEAGVGLNDGPGYRIYVVAHNEDDRSAKLIANRQVFASVKDSSTLYEDSHQTIRLVISKKPRSVVGSLAILQDGPGSFRKDHLLCYEKDSITFDKK